MLTVGTDFTGVEGFGLGADTFMTYDLKFVSEINETLRQYLKKVYPNTKVLTDAKDTELKCHVDLYCASPPCQEFSTLNNQREGGESERGQAIFASLEYIAFFQPTYFIIENVVGSEAYYKDLPEFKALSENYSVTSQILQPYKHANCPVSRKRIYYIGTPKDKPFLPLPEVPLTASINDYLVEAHFHGMTSAEEQRLKHLLEKNNDVDLTQPYCVDVHASLDRQRLIGLSDNPQATPLGVAPCITTVNKLYFTHINRCLTVDELAALMGITFKAELTPSAKRHAIGNGLCVPVITALLKQLFGEDDDVEGLLYGEDNCGIGGRFQALQAALPNANFTFLFASEEDKRKREHLKRTLAPRKTYQSVEERKPEFVHVYTATVNECNVAPITYYLQEARPFYVLLELHADFDPRCLRLMGYQCTKMLLNPKTHANVPIHRARHYLVAIHKTVASKPILRLPAVELQSNYLKALKAFSLDAKRRESCGGEPVTKRAKALVSHYNLKVRRHLHFIGKTVNLKQSNVQVIDSQMNDRLMVLPSLSKGCQLYNYRLKRLIHIDEYNLFMEYKHLEGLQDKTKQRFIGDGVCIPLIKRLYEHLFTDVKLGFCCVCRQDVMVVPSHLCRCTSELCFQCFEQLREKPCPTCRQTRYSNEPMDHTTRSGSFY